MKMQKKKKIEQSYTNIFTRRGFELGIRKEWQCAGGATLTHAEIQTYVPVIDTSAVHQCKCLAPCPVCPDLGVLHNVWKQDQSPA